MVRHDRSKREEAARLVSLGLGKQSLARALDIPRQTAEKWVKAINAVGEEAFLDMGAKHRAYDYGTKLAAVADVVERGLTKQEAMAKHGIANPTSLDKWVRAYRTGGPEALRPKPKGRPRLKPEDRPAKTREQELEDENRRLRAEVAYLKKLRSLEAAKREPGRSAR